jgi:hypothetical protein
MDSYIANASFWPVFDYPSSYYDIPTIHSRIKHVLRNGPIHSERLYCRYTTNYSYSYAKCIRTYNLRWDVEGTERQLTTS